jgi:glycosyltransferase involved in cell wall biosynthesis
MSVNAKEMIAIVVVANNDDSVPSLKLAQAITGTLSNAVCYVVQIGESRPEAAAGAGRIVNLPLGTESFALAQSIGMQLAMNEGCAFAGCLGTKNPANADQVKTIIDRLLNREADAVYAQGRSDTDSAVFFSSKAAFIAPLWGALGDELIAVRRPLLSLILAKASRQAIEYTQSPGNQFFTKWAGSLPSLSAEQQKQIFRRTSLMVGNVQDPKAAPIKRVAVITPYYKESPEKLLRCIESVRQQSHPARHFMISDGFPSEVAKQTDVTHIELGRGHADNGNTPRTVGGLIAFAQGYDALAYLDADNWFEPNHIQSMVELQHSKGAGTVCAMRNIYLPNGTMIEEPEKEDMARRHVDTSAFLITRSRQFISHIWGQMPQSWGPVCDRVVFSMLANLPLIEWTNKRTLNFESNYSVHYVMARQPVPDKVNDISFSLWNSFRKPDLNLVAETVNRLGMDVLPNLRPNRKNWFKNVDLAIAPTA